VRAPVTGDVSPQGCALPSAIMPVIDFKEIAVATSGAQRDQFELFAREFLDGQGFKIVIGPDRGPDAGRDLVVEEIRTGIAGETRLKWLVSCKHKAHSGASVTPEDEARGGFGFSDMGLSGRTALS